MMKKIWTVLFGAMAAFGQLAQANLVQDGSFENLSLQSGSYVFLMNGQMPAWNLGAAGLELRNNIVGAAFDGSNYAELDALGANSFIEQSLTTEPGQWYELSFAYANRIGWPVSSNGLTWQLGDASGAAPALPFNNGSSQDWHVFTVNWLATSTTTQLKFSAAGLSDGAGSSIDAISLTPIPEPQSSLLMLSGLLGLAIWLQKRRQSPV